MVAQEVLIAAVGGELMSDDGVGPRVLAELTRAGGYPDCRILDAGTAGTALLAELAGRERAILIDAARMGEPPGTVRGFAPGEVRFRPAPAPLSGHQISLDSVLALARHYGVRTELYFIGIEPHTVGPGYGLSPLLAARLPELARETDRLIRRQLTHWNALREASQHGHG